ncbi:MAG TPA: SirB2 family protein [Rhodocyclaceae bacterium]|jgi:uncharacterized membrane protein SirB2|nr:SirB2 family protein [Rhodocyclaceae bacterium]
MDYQTLRLIHIGCAVASGLGFFVRGLLMMRASPLLNARWVRVVPHVVDTALLGAAIGLVVLSGQYPFVVGWVTAKVLGLLAYIGLGMFALRRGRTMTVRVACWFAALVVFGYIVSVAMTRSPWGFAGLL